MEAHIGLELDIIKFPEETKKKILEIRNDKIRQGSDNWTMTDVLVYSVNMAHTIHQQELKIRANQANKTQVLKPETPIHERLALKKPSLTAKQGEETDGNETSRT